MRFELVSRARRKENENYYETVRHKDNCRTTMSTILLCSLAIALLVPPSTADVFTALVDMEALLYTEKELINTLRDYISGEERRIGDLKKYLDVYTSESESASQDTQTYLANPLNAYKLVKRLTTDWREVEHVMTINNGINVVANITRRREELKFPDDEDLNGAAVALIRLQDTYILETAALARGEIQGVKYTTALTAGDCFELGRQSYNNGDHLHTVLWMQEALDRYANETSARPNNQLKAEILEYLSFSTFMEGNVRHALFLTNELIEIAPNHPRAQGNKDYYEDAITKADVQKRGDDGSDETPVANLFKTANKKKEEVMPERVQYEKLCRGEGIIEHATIAKMFCYVVHNNVGYLVLQPIKVEVVYLRPAIFIFHDIITDREINVVKSLATPRLKRATVQNYKSGELEFANYRISKSGWLKDNDDRVVERLSQRVEQVTGLTCSTAEDLQVVNYGLGGHYEPHFDFARREEKNAFKSLGTGNRIATILFYMSDVEAGGATVFPQLNLAVRPKKGTAVFWHNLFKSGEGDVSTRHAACPVLAGSKWVCNKWLHERGQEFLRPCGKTEFEF